MESTLSVSKGVFVFKNKLKSFKEVNAIRKKGRKKTSKQNFNIFCNEPWYQSYFGLWTSIEKKIQKLHSDISSSISNDLLFYITGSYDRQHVTEIPTAALLTGVNMPDHAAQFTALIRKMKENPMLHVACLYSDDGQSIKNLVESMINQFVNGTGYSSDEDESEEAVMKIKKVNYNFSGLKSWYDSEKKSCLFVVIIPDFESFKETVLHDFILIVSSYINILPFALVFGIATSLTILHKTLPYHVSSKINIQFFNSQPSTIYLNSILENVLFSEDCPFHLGGNTFNLFTDVFVFYDLSVNGFIQKFKYAMLAHFSFGNVMTLCSSYKKIKYILKDFNHEDCENARHLLSFRKMIENESPENQIKLFTDDDYFKEILREEVEKNFKYLNMFHLFLKCLHLLVSDLPKHPLGKQLRDLYSMTTIENITRTEEYKEAFRLLQFQSKIELIEKVTNMCEIIEREIIRSTLNRALLQKVLDDIYDILEKEEIVDEEQSTKTDGNIAEELGKLHLKGSMTRNKFKDELLGMVSFKKKAVNKFECQKSKLLTYFSQIFESYLYEPNKNYFYEIFFSYDTSVEQQLIGSHRAALHAGLKDPFYYLQCKCCELRNETTILKTMPDICIAYKLHLEYGKMINLYDWLQAFVSIVNPVSLDDSEADLEISPQLQARFTQAVAELEFLGFIKSSKRKIDHVQRLTWCGL